MSDAKTISMEELLGFSEVQEAFQFFESQADQITAEQINLCSVPAPPFGEAARAEYFRQKLNEAGLANAEIDEEGNCFALRQDVRLLLFWLLVHTWIRSFPQKQI
jgi:hypothetical protein